MSPPRSIPAITLALALLCGCGAAVPSEAVAPARAADCSFRSATSCWTLAPRLPVPRPQTWDSVPDDLLVPPPALLASGADSAALR